MSEHITKWLDILLFAGFCVLAIGIPLSNAITEIGIAWIILIWSIRAICKREIPAVFCDKGLIALVGAVIFMHLMSFFSTQYYYESMRGMFKISKFCLLFLVAVDYFQESEHRKKLIFVLLVVSAIIYLDALWQHFFSVDLFRSHALLENEDARRLTASFHDPNNFGGYLVVLLLLNMSAVFFSHFKHIIWKVLLFLLFILGFYCFLRTCSKGAWLSFLVGTMCFCFLWKKRTILIFIVGLVLLLVAMPSSVKESIHQSININEGTTWERLKLWEGTLNMIKEKPLLGHGVNTYSKNFPQYKPVDYPDYRYSHNCILQMASEIGIPGVLIFLALLGYCFVRTYRKTKALPREYYWITIGAFSACIGFFAHSLIDTHLYSLVMAALFWMMLGVMYSISLPQKSSCHV